jgi:hypothetical protein
MVQRQRPPLSSLISTKAFEAEHVLRPEAADSHQGQGRLRSSNRPDRFMQTVPTASGKTTLHGRRP